jgi:hypothetical protein
MPYQMRPLACDPARVRGMSERLIVSHCENNYGGAVKRLKGFGRFGCTDRFPPPVASVGRRRRRANRPGGATLAARPFVPHSSPRAPRTLAF